MTPNAAGLWTDVDAPRQVPGDPKLAYSHVYGAPGLSAVAILGR